MKWINDKTGRFKKRPHYLPLELDLECEAVLNEFFQHRTERIRFPISTADLTVLIEEYTQDFDSCKDLSEEGQDVEGITYFVRGEKPIVCISHRLGAANLENRLRTTLTHELFHVLFHNSLYQDVSQPSLFEVLDGERNQSFKCMRDNIIGASNYDWMEWQAGYGCGAFLMPITPLNETVREYKESHNLSFETLTVESESGIDLTNTVSRAFQTSKDAARVRLLQKGILQDRQGQQSMRQQFP